MNLNDGLCVSGVGKHGHSRGHHRDAASWISSRFGAIERLANTQMERAGQYGDPLKHGMGVGLAP